MVRLLLFCCLAAMMSGCIVFPGDRGEFRPPYVGTTPVVDAATGMPVLDAKVIIIIDRSAAFIPDSIRPPDLSPIVEIERFARTDKLRYRFGELYVWPWGAFGSSGYSLNGMYVYKPGYSAVEYRSDEDRNAIQLQPLGHGTGKPELIERVLGKVEERFRHRVRRTLEERLD